MKNVFKISVGKLEGKRPIGRCRCRWKDNFKRGLKGTGSEVVDQIHLDRNRVQLRASVNRVMNFWAS
jgi:hypothetical protein